MGRRLRSHPQKTLQNDLWLGAYQKQLGQSSLIEIIGFNSPTQTVFVRVLNVRGESQPKSDDEYPNITLNHLVSLVIEEWRDLNETQSERRTNEEFNSSVDLISLGAVWVLHQCLAGDTAKPRRAGEEDLFAKLEWSEVTVRIHLVPGRFPAAQQYDWSKKFPSHTSDGIEQLQISTILDQNNLSAVKTESSENGTIVHENDEFGFAIINKPGLLPSHPTVSNACENVLSMYRKGLWKRKYYNGTNDSNIGLSHRYNNNDDIYLSLPQRLDTETSGLLVVASKKEFSSYMSKLLDKKTTMCIAGIDKDEMLVVRKKYKCLVHAGNNEMRIILKERKNEVITHYMDANSSAPRIFSTQASLDGKWLECKMRLIDIQELDSMSNELNSDTYLQVEIELLTGRTHQIRGQMAALGHPLLGDPLYGKDHDGSIHDKRKNGYLMALQCSEISFPTPEWKLNEKRRVKQLYPTQHKSLFRINISWWDKYFREN